MNNTYLNLLGAFLILLLFAHCNRNETDSMRSMKVEHSAQVHDSLEVDEPFIRLVDLIKGTSMNLENKKARMGEEVEAGSINKLEFLPKGKCTNTHVDHVDPRIHVFSGNYELSESLLTINYQSRYSVSSIGEPSDTLFAKCELVDSFYVLSNERTIYLLRENPDSSRFEYVIPDWVID